MRPTTSSTTPATNVEVIIAESLAASDTVTGARAAELHAIAVEQGVNLRRIDARHVGLSLDETTGRDEIALLEGQPMLSVADCVQTILSRFALAPSTASRSVAGSRSKMLPANMFGETRSNGSP